MATDQKPGLSDSSLRRILEITSFEYCNSLFWRKEADDATLKVFADCSDFFDWACSDVEPIETEADVDLLESCLVDLRSAADDRFPLWLADLYAARKRKMLAAPFMFSGRHAMDECYHELFKAAASA